MKKSCLTTIIALFLSLFPYATQAQTKQSKLNQMELDRQFNGTWKADSGPYLTVYAAWFTSENKLEEVLLEDISNLEKAGFRQTFEFLSTDMFVLTNMESGKVTGTYYFHRE